MVFSAFLYFLNDVKSFLSHKLSENYITFTKYKTKGHLITVRLKLPFKDTRAKAVVDTCSV